MKKIYIICLILLTFGCNKKENIEKKALLLKETEEIVDYSDITNLWDDNYSINNDYIGNIEFSSNLINIEFVQGIDNDKYLKTDWKSNEYLSEGSIILDYRNTLEDQNLIIYGHHVYLSKEPSGTHKFTPLRFLSDEKNYEENKTFSLILNSEIRNYEIVAVYYCDLVDGIYPPEDTKYHIPNYDEDYFSIYKDSVLQKRLYDINTDFNFEDKFVTFQTCVENNADRRLIVLSKQISVIKTR